MVLALLPMVCGMQKSSLKSKTKRNPPPQNYWKIPRKFSKCHPLFFIPWRFALQIRVGHVQVSAQPRPQVGGTKDQRGRGDTVHHHQVCQWRRGRYTVHHIQLCQGGRGDLVQHPQISRRERISSSSSSDKLRRERISSLSSSDMSRRERRFSSISSDKLRRERISSSSSSDMSLIISWLII